MQIQINFQELKRIVKIASILIMKIYFMIFFVKEYFLCSCLILRYVCIIYYFVVVSRNKKLTKRIQKK